MSEWRARPFCGGFYSDGESVRVMDKYGGGSHLFLTRTFDPMRFGLFSLKRDQGD